MIDNFFGQRVNFILSSTLIFLFGLVVTSVVLDNEGLPNPLHSVGEMIGLAVLFTIYGPALFDPVKV